MKIVGVLRLVMLTAYVGLIVYAFKTSVAGALAGTAIAVVEISAGVKTWLDTLNFFVLQWFGVRLERVMATKEPPPGVARGFRRPKVQIGWCVLRWVWPLTGWWGTRYRYIARRP